ncbi:hypothetical protein NQZ68_039023 [Dissostichus eleginoides]|nr:hypothetical protein NQZ68_039023 [Dissostichus eleginoides]
MWTLMGVCVLHCVSAQLFDSRQKGSPRLICSVSGPPGPPGGPGPIGPLGSEGRPGRDGRDGRDGRTREKGESGDSGLKGRLGPSGLIGVRGHRGPPGKRGPAGEQGDPGLHGPPGLEGLQGVRGTRGTRGTSGTCRCGSLTPRSAFSAGITSSYPAEKTPIRFNKVLLNEGGNYDPQTGKFMCSLPGIYFFSYHITLANKHLAIGLVHNGQYRIKTFDANTGNHDSASGSTAMFLNPEDQVWLEIFFKDQNGLFAEPGWSDSLFSGFLLYADTDYMDTLAEEYS